MGWSREDASKVRHSNCPMWVAKFTRAQGRGNAHDAA
jgi:hypothetical protein